MFIISILFFSSFSFPERPTQLTQEIHAVQQKKSKFQNKTVVFLK